MRRALLALTGVSLAMLLVAAPASAGFGFKQLGVEFETAVGLPASQAGSHPYSMRTSIDMNAIVDPKLGEIPEGDTRDLLVDLPPGFVGDPKATPYCPSADFLIVEAGGYSACPDDATLGTVALRLEPGAFTRDFPVFNLAPSPGAAAKIGFLGFGVPVAIEVGVSGGPPHNVVSSLKNIPQSAPLYGADLTLWGTPADSRHDPERGGCLDLGLGTPPPRTDCSIDIPERPFLTLPRSCAGALATVFRARSWQVPTSWVQGTATSEAVVGCEKLDLSAHVAARPTADRAESSSGFEFSLSIDNEGLSDPSEDAVAGSDVKKAVVILPPGMTVNPSQAEGLGVCSEAELARETASSEFGAGCPGSSKIGDVEVETPLLEGEVLTGSIFVAEPYANRFGSLLGLYMTIKSPKLGVGINLAGKVEPNPHTGQLVTTFGGPGTDPLPQLPFSNFRVRLREGERSPLITPPACGSYEVKAEFTPWANPASTHTETSTFQISRGVGGGPCPAPGAPPHEPGFSAGTVNNNAASHSPFTMRLTRRDGDQDLVRFDADLPKGLLAKLAGVAQCSDAQIAAIAGKGGLQERAAPSCPPNSRIGGVWAGAGVGSQLTYVPGSVYLAGPFGGAPLSVVAIVPAVAGPFDVGVVATRLALVLDPVTAEVKVDGALSQPIPHMLAGIPLRVRDIQVNVDRPDFTLNPTSCNEMAIGATLWGSFLNLFSGATSAQHPAARGARFQAANCARLGFKPRLGFRLKGGTRRGDHPAVRAVLTPRRGDANLRRTVVHFPRAAFLDQSNIRTVCTRVQWAAKACPKGSIYGRVRAWTPLLDFPLQGPVYLRSSSNKLPDLVFDLKGIVDIETAARVDSVKGALRVIVPAIPDAPVSRVVVDMRGGKRGLVVNSRNLCAKPRPRANVRMVGQNSRAQSLRPVLRTVRCGKGAKRRGR